MFKLRVWFEGSTIYFDNLVYDLDKTIPVHSMHLDEPIQKIEQHEHTVYIKGESRNFIGVNFGYPSQARLLHEYSHEIPTWMKQDFDRFLKE